MPSLLSFQKNSVLTSPDGDACSAQQSRIFAAGRVAGSGVSSARLNLKSEKRKHASFFNAPITRTTLGYNYVHRQSDIRVKFRLLCPCQRSSLSCDLAKQISRCIPVFGEANKCRFSSCAVKKLPNTKYTRNCVPSEEGKREKSHLCIRLARYKG